MTAASPSAGGWQNLLPLADTPRLSPALVWGIGISVAVHVLLLAVKFVDPERIKLPPLPQPLEVVLVNSKTKSKPVAPDVMAQANLDGGGNTDENRRAKTPLPAMRETDKGEDLRRAQKRVQELEAQQRQLLAKAQAAKPAPAPPSAETKPEPVVEQPRPSGAELANMALAMARLEAQIARQTDEYNKRPRKAFVGARATEHRLAQYVEDWRIKVERIGNLNYPTEARGRIYGSLQVTVAIRPDGSIDHMQVTRPSGYPVLDRAAEKILNLAAPFSPFSSEILKDYNMIVITRTWTFAPGDKLFGE